MKKFIIWIILVAVSSFWFFSFAEDWTIIPEWVNNWDQISTPWSIWDEYNEVADVVEDDPGTAFASGTFTWTTVMNYLKYLVKFLSGIGLVIWAVMIIYGWYKYATWVFTGKATTWNEPIKLAIYGVLVIIFSFAIIKFLLASLWGAG